MIGTLDIRLTEATCGEACWEAREDVCRCSCAGRNHGVLRNPDGKRPERTAKVDGYRYNLVAVGSYKDILAQAEALNKAAGPRRVDRVSSTLTYTYPWRETERGAPARAKPATKDQIARWPELTAWRNRDRFAEYRNPVYLLWQIAQEGEGNDNQSR